LAAVIIVIVMAFGRAASAAAAAASRVDVFPIGGASVASPLTQITFSGSAGRAARVDRREGV